MNYLGPILGLISFIIIGIFHPVVIKLEYYLGKKSWWMLAVPGLLIVILSLFMNEIVSILLGVLGFSLFWSAHEMFKQHDRVLSGRAKRNPKRKY